MMDAERQFIEIDGWESFQYSGSHKKPHPPWPWFRLHNNFIASQIWFQMTKPQRADFVVLLSLASRFGNLIPKDDKWLGIHGISSKTLPNLMKLGLIRVISLPADDNRIKALRSVLSGGTPRRGEERREEENRGNADDRAPGMKNSKSPIADIQDIAPTSAVEDSRSSTQSRTDPRSWDEMKLLVKPHIQRYGSDSDLIHRFHGSQLGMSKKQIAVCIDQLVADCEVTLPVNPMTRQ